MKLLSVDISNYRSIKGNNKIDIEDYCVIVGKNNEGKTNINRCIHLGMTIIRDIEQLRRRKNIPMDLYNWHEDYPISLQRSRKIKNENKKTEIRLTFGLNEEEKADFIEKTQSGNNGIITVCIKIGVDNAFSVSVSKQGSRLIKEKTNIILAFISDNMDIIYIPAIRTEEDAYSAIYNLIMSQINSLSVEDEKYAESLKYIRRLQQEKIEEISTKVTDSLKEFLPKIKHTEIQFDPEYNRRSIFLKRRLNVDIDDGILTNLSNKGDGVKSLVTIALLSQLSKESNRLILIDEPEKHLHSGAIHYIDGALKKLSKSNQVIISTHNPIFINREHLNSNKLVDNGQVKTPVNLNELRKNLGIIASDNLMTAQLVILVEGRSDEVVINKILERDSFVGEYIRNKELVIEGIGGSNNLSLKISSLKMMCCEYLVILDYDKAGREAKENAKMKLSIDEFDFRFFMKENKRDTELEDFYNESLYKEYLLKKGINIENNIFKDKTLKWSDKIEKIARASGIDVSKEMEDEIKKYISDNLISGVCSKELTEEGNEFFNNLIEELKRRLYKDKR